MKIAGKLLFAGGLVVVVCIAVAGILARGAITGRSRAGASASSIHFVTTITRQAGRVSPFGFRTEVIEEWVSFHPFRWRAEIRGRLPDTGTLVPTPRIFVFDGKRVILILPDAGKYHVLDPSLARCVQSGTRPLIPEDFLLPSKGARRPTGPSQIELNGQDFSSVVLDQNRPMPGTLFAIPPGYASAGVIRTPGDLMAIGGSTWPFTLSPGQAPTPMAPLPRLQDFVRQHPQDSTGHYMLATGLWAQGDTRGAIKEFEKAAMLDPKSPYPHNDLAVLFEEAGQIDRAISELTKSVALDSSDPLAWENLARLYRTRGRNDKAAAASRKAQALRGTSKGKRAGEGHLRRIPGAHG